MPLKEKIGGDVLALTVIIICAVAGTFAWGTLLVTLFSLAKLF